MSAVDEIRAMREVVDEYIQHTGVIDPVAYTRVLHACIPSDGYRGIKPIEVLLRDCFERLIRVVDSGRDIRAPQNYVIKVWSDALRGKDASAPGSARGGAPSSERSEAETFADLAREIEATDRRLFADEGRNRRVAAIEKWRRDRMVKDDVPCPNWALQGFDSPEEYRAGLERSGGVQVRAMRATRPSYEGPRKPRRGESNTMHDAINSSAELRNQQEINNPYADE